MKGCEFEKKSFSVGGYNTDRYSKNYQKIFNRKSIGWLNWYKIIVIFGIVLYILFFIGCSSLKQKYKDFKEYRKKEERERKKDIFPKPYQYKKDKK